MTSKPERKEFDKDRILAALPAYIRSHLSTCPRAGSGVHSWIFGAALRLRSLPPHEACIVISLAVRGCGRTVPPREVNNAIINSRQASSHSAGRFRNPPPLPPGAKSAPGWPKVDPEKRNTVLAASPITLDALSTSSPHPIDDDRRPAYYLEQLFPKNSLLCICRDIKKPALRTCEQWCDSGCLMHRSLIVPSPMSADSGLTADGRESKRCLGNTGPRLYIVTEFDNGTLDEQATIITHLRTFAPLVMVVYSGGKSLHAWWNAAGVAEDVVQRFFRTAVTLGADPSVWPRCQLVRLPQGCRVDTNTLQSVEFFNPGNLSTAEEVIND